MIPQALATTDIPEPAGQDRRRTKEAGGSSSSSSSDDEAPSSAPAPGAPQQKDLLTGFHLVDGQQRLFVLEAAAGGTAAEFLQALVTWSLEDQEEENKVRAAELAAAAERAAKRKKAGLAATVEGEHEPEQLLERKVLFNPAVR